MRIWVQRLSVLCRCTQMGRANGREGGRGRWAKVYFGLQIQKKKKMPPFPFHLTHTLCPYSILSQRPNREGRLDICGRHPLSIVQKEKSEWALFAHFRHTLWSDWLGRNCSVQWAPFLRYSFTHSYVTLASNMGLANPIHGPDFCDSREWERVRKNRARTIIKGATIASSFFFSRLCSLPQIQPSSLTYSSLHPLLYPPHLTLTTWTISSFTSFFFFF